MNKELLAIEFRYYDVPKNKDFSGHESKTITIGIYDTLEEAIMQGNKTLDILSKKFEVRPDDKFKLRHLFGIPQRLVTNTCYTTKGIAYFAKITTLKFDDLGDTIEEVFKATERYRKHKSDDTD